MEEVMILKFLNSKSTQHILRIRPDPDSRFAQDFANKKVGFDFVSLVRSWLRHVFEFSEIFKMKVGNNRKVVFF